MLLFSSRIHELVLDRLDSIKNYKVVVKFLPNEIPNKLSKQGFQTSFAYSFQTKHKIQEKNTDVFLCFVWKLYAKLVWKPCLDSLFGILFGRQTDRHQTLLMTMMISKRLLEAPSRSLKKIGSKIVRRLLTKRPFS